MTNTTVYYNKTDHRNGWGFCDPYDSDTGEVWELKRITCSQERAETQLNNYTKGRLAHKLDLELRVGGKLIEGKHRFLVTDESGTYDITYWQGENGILRYDYVYRKSDAMKELNAASAACVAMSLATMAVGRRGAGCKGVTVIQFDHYDRAA